MIVVMAAHATEAEIKDVEQRIIDWGYGVHPIYGAERTVIGAVGVPEVDKARYMESLESLPYVEQVISVLRPYKLASKEFRPEGTVIDVKATGERADECVRAIGQLIEDKFGEGQ